MKVPIQVGINFNVPLIDTPYLFMHYYKNVVFGGFSGILLSRFSLLLKIIVKSK